MLAATFAGGGFIALLQPASPDPGAGTLGQRAESSSRLLTSAQTDGGAEELLTIRCPRGYCCSGDFSVELSRKGHMSRFPHGKPRWRGWEDTEMKLAHGQACYWRAVPHQFSPELPEPLALSGFSSALPPSCGYKDRLERCPVPRSWARQSTSRCSRGDVTSRQLRRSEVNGLLLYVLKKAAAPSLWHFQLIIPGVTD